MHLITHPVTHLIKHPITPFEAVPLPRQAGSRLTHARLRRPTALPSRVARGFASSYLQRVIWLFTGS